MRAVGLFEEGIEAPCTARELRVAEASVHNPVDGLWADIERSPANLAARALSEWEALLRGRLDALRTGTHPRRVSRRYRPRSPQTEPTPRRRSR